MCHTVKVVEYRNRLLEENVESASLEMYSKPVCMWSQAICSGWLLFAEGLDWRNSRCLWFSELFFWRERKSIWRLKSAGSSYICSHGISFIFLMLFTDSYIQSWYLHKRFSFWSVVFTVGRFGSFFPLSMSDGVEWEGKSERRSEAVERKEDLEWDSQLSLFLNFTLGRNEGRYSLKKDMTGFLKINLSCS